MAHVQIHPHPEFAGAVQVLVDGVDLSMFCIVEGPDDFKLSLRRDQNGDLMPVLNLAIGVTDLDVDIPDVSVEDVRKAEALVATTETCPACIALEQQTEGGE